MALVLLGIPLAAHIHLRYLGGEIRHQAGLSLLAVADLQVDRISAWRESRLADAFTIGSHQLVARTVQEARVGSAAARRDLSAWTASWLRRREYQTVAVYGAGEELLASAGGVPETVHVREALRSASITFSDLHRDASSAVHADLFVPLFLGEGARPIGLVMLRVDPRDRLFPLIDPWPMPSRTGEVVLSRRSGHVVQILYSPRRSGAAALPEDLQLQSDLLPARAARGEQGLLDGIDCRGRRTLAAVRPIPGTTWSLFAKVDVDEIEAPLRARRSWLVLLGGLLAAGFSVSTVLWWQAQLDAFRRQHEAERARLALERHFDYLTRHANDILLLADGRLRIVEANDRAASAYGYDREELLGRHLREILAPRVRPGLDARVREIEAGQGAVFETVHLRRDGSTFPVEVSSRVIEVEGERYYQSIIRDVTERKRAENALRRSEQRLQLALEVGGQGIWDWHIRRDEIYLSPTLQGMLGCSPAELEGGEAVRRLFHPDDRAATAREWESLLDGRAPLFDAAMRLRARTGEWKSARMRCRVVERDRAGRPVRLVGTIVAGTEKQDR